MRDREYPIQVNIDNCPMCNGRPNVYRSTMQGWSNPPPLIHRIYCNDCALELNCKLIPGLQFESLESLISRWDNDFKRRTI